MGQVFSLRYSPCLFKAPQGICVTGLNLLARLIHRVGVRNEDNFSIVQRFLQLGLQRKSARRDLQKRHQRRSFQPNRPHRYLPIAQLIGQLQKISMKGSRRQVASHDGTAILAPFVVAGW